MGKTKSTFFNNLLLGANLLVDLAPRTDYLPIFYDFKE